MIYSSVEQRCMLSVVIKIIDPDIVDFTCTADVYTVRVFIWINACIRCLNSTLEFSLCMYYK